MTEPLATVLYAYLLGSIPFSYLIVKLVTREDLRQTGSGNVGATNVARTAGKLSGVFALALDLTKGWLAVSVARFIVSRNANVLARDPGELGSSGFWIGVAGVAAVVGHMFPLWLRFRGGKGVATAAGVFLAMSPVALGLGLIVFVAVATISRYVSLASMSAAAAVPLLLRYGFGAGSWITMFSTLISILVILKHHTNVARLARGTERKFPR